MAEVLLDALVDSLKILPIILVVYFLIEFIELYFENKIKRSKFLKGKWSPVFGSLFGSIPQCGFSVVASDLYSNKKLSVGALIAVFIATSDEALPIMISDPDKITYLLLLIGVKIVMGIIGGYLAMSILPALFSIGKKKVKKVESTEIHSIEEHHDHLVGCCSHEIKGKKKYNWIHPLKHSAKIFITILIVNIIMGAIIYSVGMDKLTDFLKSSYVFQPLLACVVGLIPNCASSVVLTQLFMIDALSFGSIVAGLSVNAGIAFAVLFKQNKSVKENILIVLFTFIFSLAVGYALHFII